MSLPVGEQTVRVLAAVIQTGERYLVCLRPGHKRHGGLWEFPGGKVEGDETHHDAARRELKEELGVGVVATGECVFSSRDPGSAFLIEFVRVEISGEPRTLEHKALQWADCTELLRLPMAPSDHAFGRLFAKQALGMMRGRGGRG
jgi:8-oxo-dGTP pyrophosphatase MutT (NUDIX family)